jgi:hypothetical protein
MKYAYPVVLLCLASVAHADLSEIPVPDKFIGNDAAEIMTQGTIVDVQFSQEQLGSQLHDPFFIEWLSLVQFQDMIFVCRVEQMLIKPNEYTPKTSCLKSD